MDWWIIGKAVVGGTITCVVAPIAISVAGFTGVGVAAGSAAAAVQATMGGTIVAGSAFALLQSAGAVGLALTTKAALFGAGAGAFAAVAALVV